MYGDPEDLRPLISETWKEAGEALSNLNLEHKGHSSGRILSVVVHHRVDNPDFLLALERLFMHNTYYD